jgi:hypothetical protein
VWGKRCLLKVIEKETLAEIELRHNKIVLQVRPTWSTERKQEFLDAWYRAQLKAAIPQLIAPWESVIGVTVERVFVQRMRTKWGVAAGHQRLFV